jgi:hypothetical protein
MFARGSIFLDENFQFRDGTKGRKLLILLNNPAKNDPYFLVKTTSKQHEKSKTPGCIEQPYQAYFIQGNSGDFFEVNTWIQLDDYFMFEQKSVKKKLNYIGKLSEKTTKLVIDCFRKINEQDLSPKILDYLYPKIEQGIRALANKFNKR